MEAELRPSPGRFCSRCITGLTGNVQSQFAESTDRDRLEAGFAMGQDVDSHVGILATVQTLLLL